MWVAVAEWVVSRPSIHLVKGDVGSNLLLPLGVFKSPPSGLRLPTCCPVYLDTLGTVSVNQECAVGGSRRQEIWHHYKHFLAAPQKKACQCNMPECIYVKKDATVYIIESLLY